MTNKAAPVKATQENEEDLPKTAVKLSGKAKAIMDMHEQLSQFEEKEPATVPAPKEPEISEEETTFKKRYGDLRRHSQQLENKYKQEVSELNKQVAQLSAAASQPMPKTKDEFEAWKAKYPDIVPFIEMVADEKASARAAQLQEELTSVKEKLLSTEEEKALATLEVLVPRWRETVVSSEYNTWLSNQPQFVQDILNNSNNPDEIAYYLNLFKTTLPKTKVNGQDKLAVLDTSVRNTGTSPSNNKSWKFLASQISNMSPQEFEKNEQAIMEARTQGLIYDDTKKYQTVFDV